MTELTQRFRDIFLEVFAAMPRQGPGNRECAARALGLCRDLPPVPAILALVVQEIELHRKYSEYYACEFFVARKKKYAIYAVD